MPLLSFLFLDKDVLNEPKQIKFSNSTASEN